MGAAPNLHVRPGVADDWPSIAALRQAAFSRSGDADVLLDGMWVLVDRGSVRGCARLEAEGQWIGGRVVPTGLVSSVAIAPEARGRGFGRVLLRAVAHEARAAGQASLVLYPSAVEPYRRAGFEIAGTHVTLSVGTMELPRTRDVDVKPICESDLPSIMACYDRLAASCTGAIARSERWWRSRVLAVRPPAPGGDGDVYAYAVGRGAALEGYIVHTLQQVAGGYESRAVCRDIVWHGEGAARGLLGLVAGGRPHVTEMEWSGSLADPIAILIDAKPRVLDASPWMGRLLDPGTAIEAQGFPGVARADLVLRVADPFEPAWSQTLRLHIEDGVATAAVVAGGEPADRTAAVTDVGTLAAILAGGLDPAAAVRLRRLTLGSGDIGDVAALVPRGARWIGDRF